VRKVTVKTLYGQTEIDVGDIGMGVTDGETVLLTDEQAEIALRNPNFVDAETGVNPNFTCATCGKTTYETALLERHRISDGRGPHTSTMVDGKRYCEEHLPRDIAPAAPLPEEAAAAIGVTHEPSVEE